MYAYILINIEMRGENCVCALVWVYVCVDIIKNIPQGWHGWNIDTQTHTLWWSPDTTYTARREDGVGGLLSFSAEFKKKRKKRKKNHKSTTIILHTYIVRTKYNYISDTNIYWQKLCMFVCVCAVLRGGENVWGIPEMPASNSARHLTLKKTKINQKEIIKRYYKYIFSSNMRRVVVPPRMRVREWDRECGVTHTHHTHTH